MSCSVKISCGKSWSGSQRRINSLAEEVSACASNAVATNCACLQQAVQQPTAAASASSTATTTTSTTATTTVAVAVSNPAITTAISTVSTIAATAAGNQRVVPPRPIKSIAAKKGEDTTKLLKYIDDNVIGKNGTFFGPFGRRKVVYCDYTASGRSLQFLEDYIAKEVLPCLGDTRASTSICSLQSSLFRHEARDIVRHAVGAGEQDAVLFTGQGTAAALRTLLRHLDLSKSTVVFVGPFEHHANLRPWRELDVKIVRISETKEGFLDLNDLERGLARMRSEGVAQMIGCFSAASCITGVLADDVATTLLLHQYGALSVWDYTTAAPYIQIDMNPHLPGVGETAVHKDAIIFAGHKFIGGVQSPGVLVAKRWLLREDVEAEDMRDSHRYHRDPELREESGTGAVVESIRCGLAAQLKENVTPRAIVARQDKISRQVLAHVRTIPELILLGSSSQNVKRLPIFSFMVRHPRGTFLHHNFVCAVLNDVFGIQARGGCACTGRYAHDLMGIDRELAKEYESILLEGQRNGTEETTAEGLRPGFARLSFPYFMSETEVAFVLEALKMVATEGWKLLPQYVLNPDTGEWRHHTNSVFKERKWLGSIRYTDGKMNATERRVSGSGVFPQSYGDCLQTARNIFNRARKMAQRYPLQIDKSFNFMCKRMEALRWFMLPSEAQDLLLGNSQNVKQDVPFNPLLAWNRYNHTHAAANCHDSLVNCLANGIRRLNSDIPRTGNSLMSASSPRHRSLPALSSVRRTLAATTELNQPSSSSNSEEESPGQNEHGNLLGGHRSPATCPNSPMPVRFAVGEAVTSSMLGSISRTETRQKEQRELDAINAGRTRCNSLGSTTDECNTASNRVGAPSAASPIPPLPLSPQTLTSLGLSTSNSTSRHRRHHCSCSSQTDLNSLDLDPASPSHSISSLSYNHNPASPPSSYSSTSDYTERLIGGGRSSPISVNICQRSEDDLSAYVKEVTKELATEIKSEIREVISKVDDALSETNTSESTPQHHSRAHSMINQTFVEDKHQLRHDSFTASDIAEYLMEFSKEMASEVKSEIRCMVNAVDGLHRYSPDASTSDVSSNGCGSPDRGRVVFPSSTSPRLSTSKKSGPIEITSKVGELSQQESKMSSECSSDETVIYVMKPSENEQIVRGRSKTEDEEVENDVDDYVDDDSQEGRGGLDIGDARKILPKIYSAVNSVSSQDSGINLSFHESDKSIDSLDLKRSSSAESNSTNSYGRKPRTTSMVSLSTKSGSKQQTRQSDNLSEDEECPGDLREEDDDDQEKFEDSDSRLEFPRTQWHCPPKNIWKPSVEAMQEFDMIRDNDKVLVCLSANGKDSLSLLHTLHQYRFYARSKGIDFEIGAATIDGSGSDPLELMTYLKTLDVPYFYEERVTDSSNANVENVLDASVANGTCSFCDRSVRTQLYSLAKRNRYNVLALGQHLDDLTESFLISVFHGGILKTMKAHYYIRREDLRVIRPFIYVREKALRQFTESKKLPVAQESRTPHLAEKQNKRKELLLQQERSYPRLHWSVRTALRPLITGCGQITDFDLACGGNNSSNIASPNSSTSSSISSTCSSSNSNTSNQQKRHRRTKTNAPSSQQADENNETDEEPIL
ncbi:tRNA 2-thiocytidine biosynthesis protein TtcA [Ooceraea biroi]|uniref:tRNA 2-thiocytidine biosynthesis protein TtcA n=1 Tax=Ooceraea biroi TaxID=2015173 RepID=A0A026WD25_OOCBI|nr:tRNA 2-thiocytidine biosynthesis protein TtcA [Ooceraea biroi]